MTCSIIIATRNRCADIVSTINALSRVRRDGCGLEVLIVDNQSTDETGQAVKGMTLPNGQLRYLYFPRAGKSAALNSAVRTAKGEILIFLDDDVRPCENWLFELTEPLIRNGADVCVGDVILPEHLDRPWMQPMHRMFLAGTVGSPTDSEVVITGANYGVNRRVFEKVPEFDCDIGPGTKYWCLEDSLFSQQLRVAGYRFKRVSTAAVEHHFSPTRLKRESFLVRAQREGASIAYFDWHWAHYDVKRPGYLTLRKRAKLALLRCIRRKQLRTDEGCPDWEMNLVQQIAYFSQYAEERRKPRAYEKHALVKTATKQAQMLPQRVLDEVAPTI